METRKRRRISIDAVFDIETQDWTTFVCGGIYTKDGSYYEYRFDSEEEMARDLAEMEGSVWAHNGGGFDFKWLLDWFMRWGLQCRITSAGGTIIAIYVGKLRLFDSLALTKISLAKFTEGMEVEKTDTGLPCVCGNYCGGYCSIKRDMSPEYWKRTLAYLETDCKGLFHALEALQTFADNEDIDLGATVGGSAWRNASRLLDLPNASDDVPNHMFVRDSYFGGRVQLFRPQSIDGGEYDVNSMYPSRLAFCKLPAGTPTVNWGLQAHSRLMDCVPGFYECEVEVPYMHLPPLPVRTKDRVIYPYGRFRGTWALPELKLAASLGVKIQSFQSLTYPREEVIFRDWIDKLFAIRRNAPGGKSGPMGTFVKYYLNSLTGKFGSKPIAERVVINLATAKIRPCNCRVDCGGLCGAHTPLDLHGRILTTKSFRIDNCAHIEWASYLTSEARCEWHRQAVSNGDGGLSIVYGDTDSLFSELPLTRNIGNNLGQWQSQGEYSLFEGLAPKVYSFKRAEKRTLKAKGVPLAKYKDATDDFKQQKTREAMVRVFAGEQFKRSAPKGFRKGAKDGRFFERVNQTRSVSRGFGDRIFDEKAGYTIPPEYDSAKHRIQTDSAESDSDPANYYEEDANTGEEW